MTQATAESKVSLQEFTKLPVREIVKSGEVGGAVLVKTPHKGLVIIDYKEKIFRGFLIFGYLDTTDKKTKDIVEEIVNLEKEAKEFLLDEWLNLCQRI